MQAIVSALPRAHRRYVGNEVPGPGGGYGGEEITRVGTYVVRIGSVFVGGCSIFFLSDGLQSVCGKMRCLGGPTFIVSTLFQHDDELHVRAVNI